MIIELVESRTILRKLRNDPFILITFDLTKPHCILTCFDILPVHIDITIPVRSVVFVSEPDGVHELVHDDATTPSTGSRQRDLLSTTGSSNH